METNSPRLWGNGLARGSPEAGHRHELKWTNRNNHKKYENELATKFIRIIEKKAANQSGKSFDINGLLYCRK